MKKHKEREKPGPSGPQQGKRTAQTNDPPLNAKKRNQSSFELDKEYQIPRQNENSLSENVSKKESMKDVYLNRPQKEINANDLSLDPNGSYVIIKTTNNVSFRKIGPFWPHKQLQCFFGDIPFKCDAPPDGSFIVQTKNPSQTLKLLSLTKFCDQPVSIELDSRRNSSKGLIYAPELRDLSEEEILQGLSDEGVVGVRRIFSKRGEQRKSTPLLILNFNRSNRPTQIVAGYLRYEVRVFIASPLRCYKCQQYGHGSRNCRNEPRCFECGQLAHGDEPCSSTKCCATCHSLNHTARSNACPIWQKEKTICSIQATKNVTFSEARRMYNETARQFPTTYANVTASNSKRTCTVGTQTESTYPSSEPQQICTKSMGDTDSPASPTTTSQCTQSTISEPTLIRYTRSTTTSTSHSDPNAPSSTKIPKEHNYSFSSDNSKSQKELHTKISDNSEIDICSPTHNQECENMEDIST